MHSTPEEHLPDGVAVDTARSVRQEVLGRSGNLRALIGTPATLEKHEVLRPLFARVPILAPGVHSMGLLAPDRESLVVVSLAPLDPVKGTRPAGYRVGR